MQGSRVSFDDFNKQANEQWARMREQDKEPFIRRAKELADHYKKIEVRFLRKKVRQMIHLAKDGRRRAVQGSN